MKKLLFIKISILIITLSGCNTVDDGFGTESFEHFSSQIQNDELFKEYSNSFENQLKLTLANVNNKVVFDKEVYQTGIASVKSKEDYLRLCEKAGISNPEEKMEAHLRLIKAQKALFEKYPRLLQLTKAEFNKIMYKSNREISKQVIERRYSNNIK